MSKLSLHRPQRFQSALECVSSVSSTTNPARRSSNPERTESRRSRALGLQPARHVRNTHRPTQ
ncbi:hypothetical protein CORC01_10892 [Colletotrichum orchidophilum]|uniref:Uncharacterized protein n=1 Tax=Colletotrichum orchidophilum TaxID=1209926 RepID=A0A1G4AXC4_9PEZI|nr:uncharacterized protein CORC01_10892 [Colletotrichum orchidophilum]OHE93766.1 hypothetical protein CORC01_10892 [Colletotrichum orchidophilum]